MKDLTHAIPTAGLETHEVMHVFLGHFGRAEGSSPFVYKYQRETQAHFVTLTFTHRGAIKSITATDDYPDEDQATLVRAVQEQLIQSQDLVASWNVLFSTHHSMQGFFQYRDRFQVRPMPSTAPSIAQLAGEQPFVIVFSHHKSSNTMIHQMRRLKETVLLGRYLNLLLNTDVHPAPPSTGFGWALDASDPATPTSRWTQLGYVPGPMPDVSLPLTAPSDIPPLVEVEASTYYSRIGHFELTIPDNLEASLDRIFSLTLERRLQFDLATTWLAAASKTWFDSSSLSYAALVIAIEALLEPRAPERCECCGQDRHATTQ